jgi:hypothetical protein
MEVLGTVAEGLGITSTAIHSVDTLIHDINAITDAPDVVADLKDELAAVEAMLSALNNAHESQLEILARDAKRPVTNFVRSWRCGQTTRMAGFTGGIGFALVCSLKGLSRL